MDPFASTHGHVLQLVMQLLNRWSQEHGQLLLLDVAQRSIKNSRPTGYRSFDVIFDHCEETACPPCLSFAGFAVEIEAGPINVLFEQLDDSECDQPIATSGSTVLALILRQS